MIRWGEETHLDVYKGKEKRRAVFCIKAKEGKISRWLQGEGNKGEEIL